MMGNLSPDAKEPDARRYRRLRAVLAADVANFGGLVSVDETNTLDALWAVRRIAREELALHGGWLFGMPGDGIFALFESAVEAVRCALNTQAHLAADPKLSKMRLRIGVHLGDVLFQDDLPFGETLVIAARLESLADPGGILISAAVMEAVAPRIAATFCERGMFNLKHSPRRIATFSVSMSSPTSDLGKTLSLRDPLDRTILSVAPEATKTLKGLPLVPSAPAETQDVSLPKVTPLVVPTASPDMNSACCGQVNSNDALIGSNPSKMAQIQACQAELATVLTAYVGPVARLLVKRYINSFTDLSELAEALAHEIPSKEERLQFLASAQHIVTRQRH
jgi:class 3 adenylate cyclase